MVVDSWLPSSLVMVLVLVGEGEGGIVFACDLMVVVVEEEEAGRGWEMEEVAVYVFCEHVGVRE